MKRLQLVIYLCLFCLLPACRKESRGSVDGREVQVSLCLNPSSKSSCTALGDSVDDLCLWVFRDGRLDSYVCQGACMEVRLSLPAGHMYSFYALANTGMDISKSCGSLVSEEGQMCGLSVATASLPMGEPGRSMPMSAWLSGVPVDGSTQICLDMVRLFSRIRLTYNPDVQLAGEHVSITDVVLRNVPVAVCPFADDSFCMEVEDGDRATISDLNRLNGGGYVDFYCPENCCGVSGNTDPRRKTPEDAPHGNATYVEVTAEVNGPNLSGHVTWRFCPGSDNCSDYNLRRGHQYDISFQSLFSTIDGGLADWQVDSGDIGHAQGKQIRLYVGQFRKFPLREGDKVAYFDDHFGHWLDVVYYDDEDDYHEELGNGCCLVSRCSSRSGESANHEFYIYSSAVTSQDASAVPVRILHDDGSEDISLICPPVVPSAYAGLVSVRVNEDGWDHDLYALNLDGSLGSVDCDEFRIPDGYLGDGLDHADSWGLFRMLYTPEIPDMDDMPFGVELSMSGGPHLSFHGRRAVESGQLELQCPLFSHTVDVTVAPAFPGQGYLGHRYNYIYAPNDLESAKGGALPDGISSHASWTVDTDHQLSVRGNELIFGKAPGIRPAYGHQLLRGSVVNPHTGRKIEGEYEVDVMLYLPLMATESLDSSEPLIGASVAVGPAEDFHEYMGMWEDVYSDLFHAPGHAVQMELSHGASHAWTVPSPSYEDAVFQASFDRNPHVTTPEFLARYAAVSLVGFVDPATGRTERSLEIPGALLVRFEDVNTKFTPACNIYGEGNRVYECLWGRIMP